MMTEEGKKKLTKRSNKNYRCEVTVIAKHYLGKTLIDETSYPPLHLARGDKLQITVDGIKVEECHGPQVFG